MTRITNLHELQLEKQRLLSELRLQKALVQDELRLIKQSFAPVQKVLSFLGILKRKESDTTAQALLKSGANLGIDLVGHKVLSRASWLSRLLVPLVAKSLSSKLVSRFVRKKS